MTYRDAVDYLSTFVNFERRPHPNAMRQVRLTRMQELCRRLGDPHRRFRTILVTGTNGKGSVCAMLYSMLREGRLRAGLYTSPHLESLRERIRVCAPQPLYEHGDDWISEEAFVAILEEMRPVLEDMRVSWAEGAPTYFEIMTAAALVYFEQQRVDIAVLEIGLGGRLDATNIVEQAVSVIGPIDIDHADVLGYDPVTIAREKAGIIKPGQAVISAPQREDVLAVLRGACEEQGVPLVICGEDLTFRIHDHRLTGGLACTVTGLRGIYEDLAIPLLGRHQAQNAAVAIGALESLSTQGIPHTMVQEGLKRVVCPGRFELIQKAPFVILDGGHNPQAAGALRQTVEELFAGRHVHLLIGMSSDKSVEGYLERLAGLPLSATCTMSRHPRALDPIALAKRLEPYCADVHVMSDPADAYTYLINAAAPADVIVVAGSFFLVGELRSALRRSHVAVRRRAPHRDLVSA